MREQRDNNCDPTMIRFRVAQGRPRESVKPGGETGGMRVSPTGIQPAAADRPVITWIPAPRRQPSWGCLVMRATGGFKLDSRGDGHARAARREADWYGF